MASFEKSILFNDGEGVDHNDLNRLVAERRFIGSDASMTGRVVTSPTKGGWLSGFDTFHTTNDTRLYTLGGFSGSLYNSSGLDVEVLPGVVAYHRNASAVLTRGEPHMHTVPILVADTGRTFTIADNTGGGSARYDLIIATPTQALGGSVTRDFKDAVTGALTTTSTNKDDTETLTFSTVQGTPGSGPPATPAGSKLVGYVRQPPGGSTIDEVHDATYPIAAGGVTISSGFNAGLRSSGWTLATVGPSLSAAAAGDRAFITPLERAGNFCARVTGCTLTCILDNTGGAPSVDLVRVRPGLSVAVLEALTFTPSPGRQVLSFPLADPVWLSGFNHAGTDAAEPQAYLALDILSGSSTDRIEAVQWEIFA